MRALNATPLPHVQTTVVSILICFPDIATLMSNLILIVAFFDLFTSYFFLNNIVTVFMLKYTWSPIYKCAAKLHFCSEIL